VCIQPKYLITESTEQNLVKFGTAHLCKIWSVNLIFRSCLSSETPALRKAQTELHHVSQINLEY
jgi:hypothetical protein